MINTRQTFRNGFLSALNVIVSGVSLFLIYQYLLGSIGAEKLGVWSIVMAIALITKISDMGFSGGMTKYIAAYNARNDLSGVHRVISTGVISLGVIVTFISVVLYFLFLFCIPLLFEGVHHADAIGLLPYGIVSFGFLAVSGIFLASLDGLQRADLRNIILIFGTLVYVVLLVFLTDAYGFIGLGYAQLFQSLFLLIVSWVVLRRLSHYRSLLPLGWDRHVFLEMIGYNAHLQVGSIASMLLEPTTKILLGVFGTLSMVTYFDMASKLVSQFRAVIVNVNQVLVPVVADLQEKNTDAILSLYHATYRYLYFFSLAIYGVVALCIPWIALVWIGRWELDFVVFSYIILVGMFINTLVGAAYFTNMGIGDVGVNTKAQVIIGLSNVVFALILERFFGGIGIIMGYTFAIISGSLFLLNDFYPKHSLSRRGLIPHELKRFSLIIALSLAIMVSVSVVLRGDGLIVMSVFTAFGGGVLGWIILREKIMRELLHSFLHRRSPQNVTPD